MIILIFIFGIVMGSFYNVVGLRLPTGGSLLKPKYSRCLSCEHTLKWYENIPIFSFLFLRGKCRHCYSKISWVYPIIEFLTGSLFTLMFCLYGFSYHFYAGIIIASVVVIIFVSDFTYKIILDSPLIIGSVLILVLKFIYFDYKEALFALLAAILLFGFLFIVKLIGDKTFKKESLGGGDVKLAFFIGMSIGFPLGLISIVISSFIALPYALISTFKNENDKEIPFGPFLVTGMYVVFIFQEFFQSLIGSII